MFQAGHQLTTMRRFLHFVVFSIGLAMIASGIFLKGEVDRRRGDIIENADQFLQGNYDSNRSELSQGENLASILLLVGAALALLGLIKLIFGKRKDVSVIQNMTGDKYEQLEKLQELLNKGTITAQEFDKEKKRILK